MHRHKTHTVTQLQMRRQCPLGGWMLDKGKSEMFVLLQEGQNNIFFVCVCVPPPLSAMGSSN